VNGIALGSSKSEKTAKPERKVELLQKRLASLEKELALLKSAIEIADGTMRLTIKKEKREAIGANERIEVGTDSQHRIRGSRTETVGRIARSQSEPI
jgi:hypothetical protein